MNPISTTDTGILTGIPITPEDPETRLYFFELNKIINRCGSNGFCEINPVWDISINRKALADMIRNGHITFQLLPGERVYPMDKKIQGHINITSPGIPGLASPANVYSSYGSSNGTFELPLPPASAEEIPEQYIWLIKPTPEGLEVNKTNTFADKL